MRSGRKVGALPTLSWVWHRCQESSVAKSAPRLEPNRVTFRNRNYGRRRAMCGLLPVSRGITAGRVLPFGRNAAGEDHDLPVPLEKPRLPD